MGKKLTKKELQLNVPSRGWDYGIILKDGSFLSAYGMHGIIEVGPVVFHTKKEAQEAIDGVLQNRSGACFSQAWRKTFEGAVVEKIHYIAPSLVSAKPTPAMIDAAKAVFDVRFFDQHLSADDAKDFFTKVWQAMHAAM